MYSLDFDSQFHSHTEGSRSKWVIDTAHSAPDSKDVDALKFRRVQYCAFYNGQIQQDIVPNASWFW